MGVLKLLGMVKLSEYQQLQSINVLLKSDKDFFKEKTNILAKDLHNVTLENKDLRAENSILKTNISQINETKKEELEAKNELKKQNKELIAENKKLTEERNTLENKYKESKSQLDGKTGGLTKQINKIKSQLRFALGVLYKEVRADKETEIFLKSEYQRLKSWDEARRKTTIEVENLPKNNQK